MKKINLLRIATMISVLFFCFSFLTGCASELNWNEPPNIDLDNLPHIEVPADVSTMEIEENGQALEFLIIRTFEDLDNIRNYKENDLTIRKNFILANDIVLYEDRFFLSIDGYFLGIFNGNNNQIWNLQFYCKQEQNAASLFSSVGHRNIEGGTVKNLIVFGNAFARNWAAPIANYNYGVIENIINYASVSGGVFSLGGIVGYNAESGIIKNCINFGQIGVFGSNANLGSNDEYVNIGGIAGRNGGIIENCTNYGTILGSGDLGIGGIAGSTSSSEIKNCTNYGTIIGIDIDKESGIFGGLSHRGNEPLPEKPVGNINHGSIISLKK